MEEERQKKSFEIDMVRGPVLKKMLMFSLPLMCSSILQLLFNAADIIVVGRFAGDNSLAAVGSNTSLITLMTNLFIGLSIGANVTVAKYYGAKRHGTYRYDAQYHKRHSAHYFGTHRSQTGFTLDESPRRSHGSCGYLSAGILPRNDWHDGL